MAVTLEELFMSSPRREIKLSKNKRVVRNTSLLETLAKLNGDITSRIAEDGTVKMKILVKKQDLKQMLESINVSNHDISTTTTPTSALLSSSLSSIEKRLYDLMRRRRRAVNNQACQGQHSSSWRPALHSIPEEHY